MKELSTVINIIRSAGGEARFVGGCVRDYLISSTPIEKSDIDIATTLTPEIIAELFSKKGKVITQYATNIVVMNGYVFEITTTRKDIKCDGRHAIMEYSASFEEDALRRDFTINALYMDLDGKIYDYVGGLEDIQNRIVRFIGDPVARIREDYLRILRFFRFSAFYANKINEDGLQACINLKDGISILSKERIRKEIFKLLGSLKALEILRIMQNNDIIKGYFLDNELPITSDSFVKFAYITNFTIRNDFIYTRQERRLLKLYQNTRTISLTELSYIIPTDDLNIMITFRNEKFITPPSLPISKAEIAENTTDKSKIQEIYRKIVQKFISSGFVATKKDLLQ